MKAVLFLVLVSAVAFTVLGVAIDCPGEKVTRARRAVSVDDSQDPLAGLAANYSGISYSWSIDDLSGCALNDVFNVSFVVFDHIWLKFEPVKPPASVDCQTFIFDSQIYVDEANVTYSVGILQTLPPTVSANQNLSEAFTHSFLLGNVTGEDLLDAIEVFDGEYGGDYDFITANCAIKVIDVMHFLGFDVHDRALLSWINTELQTPRTIAALRNASTIVTLYPTLNRDQILAKNDTELFGTLIDYSIQQALANYATDLVFYQAQKAPSVAPSAKSPPAKAPSSTSAPVAAGSPTANGKVSMAPALSAAFAVLSFATLAVLAIV